MSKFDEFDLDVQNLKRDSGAVSPQGVTTTIPISVIEGCTPNCLTTAARTCSNACQPPSTYPCDTHYGACME